MAFDTTGCGFIFQTLVSRRESAAFSPATQLNEHIVLYATVQESFSKFSRIN